MRTTTKIVTRLFLGIAAAGAAACSAGETTGPAGGTEPPDPPPALSITGTYRLTTVNGGPLPALLWYDDTAEGFDAEMYLESASIVLRADGTFRSTSVSSLIIEGVGEQVETSINDGTYVYAHNRTECEPSECVAGQVLLTGENGGRATLGIANRTIHSTAMIPGAPGEPDIRVEKFYER